jgi:hypothetical protein
VDLTDSVDADFERGLLGIAIDPNFTVNHYVYVYYNYRNPSQTVLASRVVRYTESGSVGTAPLMIYNQVYATSPTTYGGNHVGGIIRIRATEPTKIYIEHGDLAYNQTNPTLNYANKLNKPYGKILRINTDGTIPTDNPFYDDGNPATGNDDRIYSYGHRNMFGMCFSPITDTMYEAENGLNKWDEFNIIHKGGNYGWATCEGNYVNSSTTTLCSATGVIAPMTTWAASLPSVTGCVYYNGTAMPEFNNHILVADNDYGKIYDLTLGNAPYYDMVTSNVAFADIVSGSTGTGLTTLRQGQTDGCIYALKAGYATNGALYKICHASTTGVQNAVSDDEYSIGQTYPNPTSGTVDVDYNLAHNSTVSIDLYDAMGKLIKNLMTEEVPAGKNTAHFTGLDQYADGSYHYRMEVKQAGKLVYTETRSLIITK